GASPAWVVSERALAACALGRSSRQRSAEQLGARDGRTVGEDWNQERRPAVFAAFDIGAHQEPGATATFAAEGAGVAARGSREFSSVKLCALSERSRLERQHLPETARISFSISAGCFVISKSDLKPCFRFDSRFDRTGIFHRWSAVRLLVCTADRRERHPDDGQRKYRRNQCSPDARRQGRSDRAGSRYLQRLARGVACGDVDKERSAGTCFERVRCDGRALLPGFAAFQRREGCGLLYRRVRLHCSAGAGGSPGDLSGGGCAQQAHFAWLHCRRAAFSDCGVVDLSSSAADFGGIGVCRAADCVPAQREHYASAAGQRTRLFASRQDGVSRLAVLGAGSWGTALAIALATRFDSVGLWARDPERAVQISNAREN